MDLPLDQIICGDNCDVLGTLPRDCIDLVVTSPPYDDLRTYGGHSWDFYGVAWQLKRVGTSTTKRLMEARLVQVGRRLITSAALD